MKKYTLKIRKIDRIVLDSIKTAQKTIETRAATDKLRKIKVGDILVFECEGKKLEREVKSVNIYKSVDDLVSKIDFKKIMPFVESVGEMKKVYYSFPQYKEKIKSVGLIAFEL